MWFNSYCCNWSMSKDARPVTTMFVRQGADCFIFDVYFAVPVKNNNNNSNGNVRQANICLYLLLSPHGNFPTTNGMMFDCIWLCAFGFDVTRWKTWNGCCRTFHFCAFQIERRNAKCHHRWSTCRNSSSLAQCNIGARLTTYCTSISVSCCFGKYRHCFLLPGPGPGRTTKPQSAKSPAVPSFIRHNM